MQLNLREHQSAVIDALREGFKQGYRSQLLYAPTGFGKTEVAIALMQATADKSKRAAILLDRLVLVDQTSLRLSKYGLDHGVYQSEHWKFDRNQKLQVCSAQTLEARDDFPKVDLLIVDECFTGDTLISTPTGHKKISVVRCGDTVYNSSGVGIVLGTMARPADDLVKLEFEDGTTIECTGNHPIFTDRGWVKAAEMEVNCVSYSIQGLRLLWESILSERKDGAWQRGGGDELGELAKAKVLLKILLQEVEKPDEQSLESRQDDCNPEKNQASADSQRGEWQVATSAADCFASCFGAGVGVGVSSGNEDAALKDWVSNLLQAGHCQLGDENWDRVGRWFSLLSGKEGARFEKDRISCFPRLVNISRVERESIATVFNLHVSGHPSYFANGKLVHNCHISRKQTTEYIKANPDLKVIGLTATPFTKGLGSIYQNVVCGATNGWLVDNKWLTPLKVYIAKEIDMSGVKKVAGEWSQEMATKRGMQITGDIVSEWITKTHEVFGGPRKTIVFCAGVAHGADLVQQFAERGYNFVSISYKDDDDFKREAIEDFAKPDTAIHGLIATDILTRGFDVSDVMIGVSARPFSKSLSSHVQQMGRVMRSHDGKEFALWLDHSGNYLRFRDDWDNLYVDGVDTLDKTVEKTKKELTPEEKTASKCPKCGHLWPKGMDTCPSCGHVRERRNQVESVSGILEELVGGKKPPTDDRQSFYSELLYFAGQKNYQSGWAKHKYKEKFGVWPKNLAEIPAPVTEKTARWIRSKNIAWSKTQNRVQRSLL